MKKVLSAFVLGGLVFSHVALAKDPGCTDTVFSFQNESSNDCILKEYKILKGTIFEQSQIPEVLLRGQTIVFVVQQGREKIKPLRDYRFPPAPATMVYITYQCGNDQSISLLSYLSPQVYCSIGGKGASAEGFVLSNHNLQATFTKVNPSVCRAWGETRPAKFNWKLADR